MSLELRVPVQARSVRTRGDLVRAAREAFSEQGYALTTAKSVAQRAGVGTGTFYHYFPDKDALLREIVAERVAALEQALTGSDGDLQLDPHQLASSVAELRRRVRKDIKLWLDYHRQDKGLHAVISERRLCDPQLDALMTAVEQRGMKRTAESLKRWGFRGDAAGAAFMLFSLVDGAVHNHVLGHATLSDARFIDALAQAVLQIAVPTSILAELEARR